MSETSAVGVMEESGAQADGQSAAVPGSASASGNATGCAIALHNIRKHYGDVVALDDVSLSINDREFFTLLGPSGCGKTTLLRIIAGFESISAGTLLLHGKQISALPANQRPVNTVFQQYSLFPHMSVLDNVLFGLQMRKVPLAQARKRANNMLELVQLQDFAERMPAQLSGGQQQRVALARALAPQPEVLLLDEPLSALDLKLRQAMRIELKQIQEEAGITFIFVTHDQEEALTLSDRIAVMSAGKVQQVGTAQAIYEAPANRFVADFIGETNLIEAEIIRTSNDSLLCALPSGARVAINASPDNVVIESGAKGHLCIRPERLHLVTADQASENVIEGVVDRHVYLGTDTQLLAHLSDGQQISLRTQNSQQAATLPSAGEPVFMRVDADDARFLSH